MTKIIELFGIPTQMKNIDWFTVLREQKCPYKNKLCFKTRKSEPSLAIGTCVVNHGRIPSPVMICPNRLLERNKVFFAGNELHVISEISIPGGYIDYILVSVRQDKVVDFVGIEFQTLDTTGTIWPERQRFLYSIGLSDNNLRRKAFGMNWKMTAKTILMQLHHKIKTFEHINRHLVLVMQDCLFLYMQQKFQFSHIENLARNGDSMHFHIYSLKQKKSSFRLNLISRMSTDMSGLTAALGLQSETEIEFIEMAKKLESKISEKTLLQISTTF